MRRAITSTVQRAALRRPVALQQRSATVFAQRRFMSARVLFTKEHEWIKVENDKGTIGITNHAQNELGEVVFVELPDVGKSFKAHDSFGAVESTKAASSIYAPVDLKVVEANKELTNTPALINQSAEDKAWLIKVQITNPKQLDGLLDKKAYDKFVADSKH